MKCTLATLKKRAAKQTPVKDERQFWDWLASGQARVEYADDIHKSLFDKNCQGWNFHDLGGILDKSVKVEGVVDSYLYISQPRSFFPWHCEDHNYYSVSYLHFGEKKIWYSIAQWDAERFENMFQSGFNCKSYMRHKHIIADPEYLRRNKIPVYKAEQGQGEIIITFPRGYHCGFSNGLNCTEATNFATPEWLPFGICANMCEPPCEFKQFSIDKEAYVQKNSPGNIIIMCNWRDYLIFDVNIFFICHAYRKLWSLEKWGEIPEPSGAEETRAT